MSSKTAAARIGAAGLILAGWVATAGVAGADPTPSPSPSPAPASPAPASPSPSPAAAPGPKTTIAHDGTYAVGT
ncbi:MAG: hypothetical protein ACLPXZ_10060, partial [Mycobacterium sp.]